MAIETESQTRTNRAPNRTKTRPEYCKDSAKKRFIILRSSHLTRKPEKLQQQCCCLLVALSFVRKSVQLTSWRALLHQNLVARPTCRQTKPKSLFYLLEKNGEKKILRDVPVEAKRHKPPDFFDENAGQLTLETSLNDNDQIKDGTSPHYFVEHLVYEHQPKESVFTALHRALGGRPSLQSGRVQRC